MSTLDLLVERGAARLEDLSRKAAAKGGFAAKLADDLAEDAVFLRKLKPSLIKARAKGEAPTDEPPGATRTAPSGPQLSRPEPPKRKRGGGPSPWLVIGAALAGGYVLAKLIDWRGHAHPHN
jgi:hypothetical protein